MTDEEYWILDKDDIQTIVALMKQWLTKRALKFYKFCKLISFVEFTDIVAVFSHGSCEHEFGIE